MQSGDAFPSNVAPAIVGTEAAAAAGVACVAVNCPEAVVNGSKKVGKAIQLVRIAMIITVANAADSVVGIFSSKSPNTGNDKLDEVLVDAKPTNDGNKGYEYPGSQDELAELVSNQAW